MEITELGIVTDFRLRQPLNAFSPIYLTPLGIVTDGKPRQYWNAPFSMEATEPEMFTEVR
jgi:hypothetical protein